MADAISLLTADHRSVEALFTQVEAVQAPDPGVVASIVRELSVHDAVERELLYPTVRDLGGGEQMADRSIGEHTEQAETLLELDEAAPGSPEQVRCIAALIPIVRAHMRMEEAQVFPAMSEQMSAEDLEQLGERIERAKGSAPTRPHPRTAGEGVVTRVAGAVTGPLDRAKDAAEGRPRT